MAAQDRALTTHGRNSPRTFRTAAESYLEHGGEGRYLEPLLAHLGDRPLTDIVPFDIKQLALQLLPSAGNATRNRQVLTPARAVLMHAYERGWAPLLRLGQFRAKAPKRKAPASAAWLQIFVRQCDRDDLPHLAALVLFMTHTGARISEAVRLEWPEVELANRRAILLRTKTDTDSVRFLTDELVARLLALGGPGRGRRVFRYTSRHSVNERIAAVCRRAGITYKSAHVCGRHSFATNAMALGADVKSAMEAGGWKSSTVFTETYLHPRNAGRSVADRFNGIEFSGEL